MSKSVDLTGIRFGRLVVLSLNDERKNGSRMWKCLCDCGNFTNVQPDSLTRNKTKSCGCLYLELRRKHGKSGSKCYQVWSNMKKRCTNKNLKAYPDYGGRGITYSENWNDFEVFLKDMGNPPSEKSQLDRIDNDGNYCKENCRWISRSINRHNARGKKETSSKFKGVSFHKRSSRWNAICYRDDVTLRKQFDTETEAAIAYNEFAKQLYGEFASLNKIEMPE